MTEVQSPGITLRFPAFLLRQAVSNQFIGPGVEDQADVRALDFEVGCRVIVDADAPINDAIGFGIHCRVTNGMRARNLQGGDRIAVAIARETGGLG